MVLERWWKELRGGRSETCLPSRSPNNGAGLGDPRRKGGSTLQGRGGPGERSEEMLIWPWPRRDRRRKSLKGRRLEKALREAQSELDKKKKKKKKRKRPATGEDPPKWFGQDPPKGDEESSSPATHGGGHSAGKKKKEKKRKGPMSQALQGRRARAAPRRRRTKRRKGVPTGDPLEEAERWPTTK